MIWRSRRLKSGFSFRLVRLNASSPLSSRVSRRSVGLQTMDTFDLEIQHVLKN